MSALLEVRDLRTEVLQGGRVLTALPEPEMRRLRGNEIAMIFQDSLTALNPTMTVGRQIAETVVSTVAKAGRRLSLRPRRCSTWSGCPACANGWPRIRTSSPVGCASAA